MAPANTNAFRRTTRREPRSPIDNFMDSPTQPPPADAPPPAVRLIERQEELAPLAAALVPHERIALDSESDSFHHYHEKVCLIQLSTPEQTYLIDPLGLEDLEPLLPVCADPSIEKVLHGADYDVRTLGRDYGVRFENLFDTMIAAQMLGFEAFGLAALLQRYFGVTLNKRFQTADWSRRPLEPGMIRYAAEDTLHLLALRDRLAEELERLSRRSWHQEECRRLVAQKAAPRQPPSCFALKGTGRLEPAQQTVLQALLDAREETARATDRPPFKVIVNETLIELAMRQPATQAELSAVPGVTERLRERLGDLLLDAIRRGKTAQPVVRPRRTGPHYTPLRPAQEARLKKLKAVRQAVADALKLAPGLLCNNAQMEELVRLPTPDPVQIAERLSGWRWELLGRQFEPILLAPQGKENAGLKISEERAD